MPFRSRPHLHRNWLREATTIGAPGAIAVILGLIGLGSRSLWIDESASISVASQHGTALSRAIARDGGNMAGYYAFLHVVIERFGNSLFAVRLPSVIAAGVTAILVGVLGKRLFGTRAGLVAGLTCAVGLPAVYWSQDARSYSPLVMFVTASYLTLVAIEDATSTNRKALWSLYVIFSASALYMSFVAVFVLLAQVLFGLRSRRIGTRIVLADIATAILATPLGVLALRRGSGQLYWVPRPNWTALRQVAISLSSAGFQPNFRTGAINIVLLLATLAIFVMGILSWAFSKKQGALRSPSTAQGRSGELVVGWLCIPLAAAFAESYVTTPAFTARNLLIVLPPVALALGCLLGNRRLSKTVAYGALGALLAMRLAVLIPTYGESPENWRAATDHLVSASDSGSCVAFYPLDARMATTYYLETQHRDAIPLLRPVLPTPSFTEIIPYLEEYVTLDAARIARITQNCSSLWLVSSHEGQANGTPLSRANYLRFVALRDAFRSRYPFSQESSFGWAAPVTLEHFTR